MAPLNPSKVMEQGALEKLRRILEECDIVGLGEIGLDVTKSDMSVQHRVFMYALSLLANQPNLVLVLHCRQRSEQ